MEWEALRLHEARKGIGEQVGLLAAVGPKLKLVEICRKMLCTGPLNEPRECLPIRSSTHIAARLLAASGLCARVFHRGPDAMAKIPRRFVAHAYCALDLVRRHAIPRLADEEDGKEPLFGREAGVVKDRSRRDRELIFTLGALKLPPVAKLADRPVLTPRTSDTLGPAKAPEQLTALVVRREARVKLPPSHRDLRD
jgi:hypothetical protein